MRSFLAGGRTGTSICFPHLIILLSSRPGRGVGARPPHCIGFRLPEFRRPGPEGFTSPGLRFRAPGLPTWKSRRLSLFCGGRQVTSGLAPYRIVFLLPLLRSRPIPVGRNFMPWDCKLTPVDCTCQEGNTTGCIPSNDGLGAGLGPGFPHGGKQWIGSDLLDSRFGSVCGCKG
jgi:hypothetical protein